MASNARPLWSALPEGALKRQLLGEIAANLTAANNATAVELAAVPLEVRGFGHVKEANRRRAAAKTASLLARFRGAEAPPAIAAE